MDLYSFLDFRCALNLYRYKVILQFATSHEGNKIPRIYLLEATHKYITVYKNLLMVCKKIPRLISINYITLKLGCCCLSDF